MATAGFSFHGQVAFACMQTLASSICLQANAGICCGPASTEGPLQHFICSVGCRSCSAGLLSIMLPGNRVQTLYLYQPKKDWTRRTALSLLLSGLNYGGLGAKRAEHAASGRHLCSTDLVFKDDRREMLEHVGQRGEGATLCSALCVARAHSWRV